MYVCNMYFLIGKSNTRQQCILYNKLEQLKQHSLLLNILGQQLAGIEPLLYDYIM